MTRRIAHQTAGSTSIIWALMVLPMLVLIGAALDFSTRETGQRQIRAATDAAAIAAVRFAMTQSGDEDDVKTAAKDFFRENLPANLPAGSIIPVVSFAADDFVTVRADFDVPTTILSIAGISSLRISAESTAVYSAPRDLEIALVLDNSYSMNGSRITDLKAAVTDFIDALVDDGNDKVKLGIVPFNNFVNVGPGNRFATWIDVPGAYSTTTTACNTDHGASITNGCYLEDQICYADGVAYDCQQLICDDPASRVETCSPQTTTYDWYGCVLARPAPLDVEDGSYLASRIPGRLDSGGWGCPAPLLPLTNQTAQLNAAVGAMFAESDTMIFEGLSWGYRALTSAAPFGEGADEATFAAEGGRKILVLMSDGENSRSPDTGSGDHWASDVAYANDRTIAACDEINGAGIEVFVIAMDVTDPDTVDLLEDCAGDPGRYFSIADSAELRDIFAGISADFREIALSR